LPDTAFRWAPGPAAAAVAPQDAAGALECQDLLVRFARPPDFDDGPSLPQRVRGALGHALEHLRDNAPAPVDRRRRLFGLPPAWDVLLAEPVTAPPRVGALPEAPSRPYAIFSESRDGQVTVTIRLIGRGRVWFAEVALALQAAFRKLGIVIAPLARSRARLPAGTGESWTQMVPMRAPPDPDRRRFRLIFESPTRLASGQNLRITGGSLVSRACGALSWCGWRLDWDAAGFGEAAAALEIVELDMRPAPLEGYSGRQHKRQLMVGALGAATLTKVNPSLSALFPLAEIVGLGIGATKGMGRCRLLPV